MFKSDLALLAIGFGGVDETVRNISMDGTKLHVTSDNVIGAKYGKFTTKLPGVFAAGDCRWVQLVPQVHPNLVSGEANRLLFGPSTKVESLPTKLTNSWKASQCCLVLQQASQWAIPLSSTKWRAKESECRWTCQKKRIKSKTVTSWLL